jgi:hypothetical protein
LRNHQRNQRETFLTYAGEITDADVQQMHRGFHWKEVSSMEPEDNEDDLRDWLLVTAGHFIVIGISATYLL